MGGDSFWDDLLVDVITAKKLWSPSFWMKRIDLVPVFALTGGAVLMTSSYLVYMCFRKDYKFLRSGIEQHEMVPILHPISLKLIQVGKLVPNPGLHNTYEDMKKAEAARRAEDGSNEH